MLALIPPIDLGGLDFPDDIIQGVTNNIETGVWFCALFLQDNFVRCWGHTHNNVLGLDVDVDKQAGYHYLGANNSLTEDHQVRLDPNRQLQMIATTGQCSYACGGNMVVCVVFDDSEIQCWGENRFGHLGLGEFDDSTRFLNETRSFRLVPPEEGRKLVHIHLTFNSGCGLFEDGKVVCWGALGDTYHSFVALPGHNVTEVVYDIKYTATVLTGGAETYCLLLQHDSNDDAKLVRCFGMQFRRRHWVPRVPLERVAHLDLAMFPSTVMANSTGGKQIQQVIGFDSSGCVLQSDGTVACWGYMTGYKNLPFWEPFELHDFGDDPQIKRLSSRLCFQNEAMPLACMGYSSAEFSVADPLAYYPDQISVRDLGTRCPDGLILSAGLCRSCGPGHFGADCSGVVSCDFAGGGVCSPGTCSGFEGNGICDSCLPYVFGVNCDTPVGCNVQGGTCTEEGGCWGLEGTGECESCEPGFYGVHCKPVMCNVDGGTCGEGCDGLSGDGYCTICEEGYSGRDCQSPVTCYMGNDTVCALDELSGIHFCASETGVGGVCVRGSCFGTEGDGTCSQCRNDWFNKDCSQSCARAGFTCLQQGRCEGVRGDGTCECENDRFGQDCQSKVVCDTDRGVCDRGSCFGTAGNGTCTSCLAWWFGPRCDNPVKCDENRGVCESGTCMGVAGTGECDRCIKGWQGRYCTEAHETKATKSQLIVVVVSLLAVVGSAAGFVKLRSVVSGVEYTEHVSLNNTGSKKDSISLSIEGESGEVVVGKGEPAG